MSAAERPWARHFQDEWQRKAGDPRFPYWLRVAALAYGSHLDNGHARFKKGEIALILGTPGKPYTNVRRAIADAVEYGWLEDGSYWACLIVPATAIKKGPWVTPKPCPVHVRRSQKRSLSERNGSLSSTLSERLESETAHSLNGCERASLFLICPPQASDDRDVEVS